MPNSYNKITKYHFWHLFFNALKKQQNKMFQPNTDNAEKEEDDNSSNTNRAAASLNVLPEDVGNPPRAASEPATSLNQGHL